MKDIFLALCLFIFSVAPAMAGININTADLETLQSIPGIGTAKAKAIINYRSINGNFQSIAELTQNGISEMLEI